MVLFSEAKQQSDEALVAACQHGDATAFDEIVRRYKDRVYNVVYRFLGRHEDAADVAQEAFIRAYRGIGAFEGKAGVYTWLYRIAANLARNRLRDRTRKGRDKGVSLEAMAQAQPGAGQLAAAHAANPREAAQGRELEGVLEQCLDALPDACREVFVLRVLEQLSYAEIAEVVQCPPGTVKSRLNQARRLLRQALEQRALI